MITYFKQLRGGYDENDAVSDHIWSTLVQTEVEDVAEQTRSEQDPVPPVHVDWLNSTDRHTRQENHVNEEVNRRLCVE